MKHQLDESMTRLIREMGYHDVDSEEYDVCLYNLERLSALRSNDRHRRRQHNCSLHYRKPRANGCFDIEGSAFVDAPKVNQARKACKSNTNLHAFLVFIFFGTFFWTSHDLHGLL
jgi:hypothetical protein